VGPNGIAVVTGAGRGIGRAVAIEPAERGFEVEIVPAPIETGMSFTSQRPTPAIDDVDDRECSQQMWDMRQGVKRSYTPAPEAARRIADAILDDSGRTRYGCDDLSEQMLAGT